MKKIFLVAIIALTLTGCLGWGNGYGYGYGYGNRWHHEQRDWRWDHGDHDHDDHHDDHSDHH